MIRKILLLSLLVALLIDGSSALAQTAPAPQSSPAQMQKKEGAMEKAGAKDIVAIASEGETFKTLVKALQAAELVETLQGEGPFTVFAPTDEAFAALPEGTLEDLLKPENKAKLAEVLTYHVVPGKAISTELKDGEVETVQGSKVTIKVAEGKVMVNDATVVTADVEASNGLIHVIDKVILPPTK
jgi:uncharacterized surface protein with fasciclin (FAS1) repeats